MKHEKLHIILSTPLINNQAFYRIVGISPTTMEDYRKGKRALTPETRAKIATFLNEQGNYFLETAKSLSDEA